MFTWCHWAELDVGRRWQVLLGAGGIQAGTESCSEPEDVPSSNQAVTAPNPSSSGRKTRGVSRHCTLPTRWSTCVMLRTPPPSLLPATWLRRSSARGMARASTPSTPWVTATLTLVRAAQRSLSANLEARVCCPRGELAALGLQHWVLCPEGREKGPLCCHASGPSPRQGNVCLSGCAIWCTDEAAAEG